MRLSKVIIVCHFSYSDIIANDFNSRATHTNSNRVLRAYEIFEIIQNWPAVHSHDRNFVVAFFYATRLLDLYSRGDEKLFLYF
jgi:hypothetical protein